MLSYKHKLAITHSAIMLDRQNRYHLVGTEKVAEQQIFAKCSKYSNLRVTSNLLKVNTSAIAHIAMDLDLQK